MSPEHPIDWPYWFERWEAMQNAYVPARLARFELMLRWPSTPNPTARSLRLLDLGCGPGSLSLHAVAHNPAAVCLAVDAHPLLLEMGKQVAALKGLPITFRKADLREAAWWTEYKGAFERVLSATALHWLSAAHLAQTFARIYAALKPGGWFLNSDHVAADDPAIQMRNRETLQARQQTAFQAGGADDWDGYWHALACAFGLDAPTTDDPAGTWEGSDDGQPLAFQCETLHACGFEPILVLWREGGEAVLAAQKPA